MTRHTYSVSYSGTLSVTVPAKDIEDATILRAYRMLPADAQADLDEVLHNIEVSVAYEGELPEMQASSEQEAIEAALGQLPKGAEVVCREMEPTGEPED